jgi:hypothetical protein
MIASDDVVFAWAIGKALLIVIVSLGILVYAAWAVARQTENAAHVGSPKDSVVKHTSSVRAGKVLLIANRTTEAEERARPIPAGASVEEDNLHVPTQPTAAA